MIDLCCCDVDFLCCFSCYLDWFRNVEMHRSAVGFLCRFSFGVTLLLRVTTSSTLSFSVCFAFEPICVLFLLLYISFFLSFFLSFVLSFFLSVFLSFFLAFFIYIYICMYMYICHVEMWDNPGGIIHTYIIHIRTNAHGFPRSDTRPSILKPEIGKPCLRGKSKTLGLEKAGGDDQSSGSLLAGDFGGSRPLA